MNNTQTPNVQWWKQYDRKKHTAHFILGGDYNVDDIDWETLSVRPGGRDMAICNQYIQMAEGRSLTQVVTESMRGEDLTLDLLFTR